MTDPYVCPIDGVTLTIKKYPQYVSINLPYDWSIWISKFQEIPTYGTMPWGPTSIVFPEDPGASSQGHPGGIQDVDAILSSAQGIQDA